MTESPRFPYQECRGVLSAIPGRHGEDLERAAGQSNWSLKVARGRKGLKGASINIVYMVLVHCE